MKISNLIDVSTVTTHIEIENEMKMCNFPYIIIIKIIINPNMNEKKRYKNGNNVFPSYDFYFGWILYKKIEDGKNISFQIIINVVLILMTTT